jgi:hypothetical protein
MLPSRASTADAILDAMDLTSQVLVVLGLIAGAMVAVITVAGVLMLTGVDTHAIASQLLMGVAGASGAIVGGRVNLASGPDAGGRAGRRPRRAA